MDDKSGGLKVGGTASPIGWKGDEWDISDEKFEELLREGREVRKKVQKEFAPLVAITREDLSFTMGGFGDF